TTVFICKRSTQDRIGSEYGEEIGGGPFTRHFFRFAITGEVETAIEERSHITEHLVLFFPVTEVAEIDDVLIGGPALSLFPHQHQSIGVGIRKRSQQYTIDHTEDRSISSDAQRERQQRDKRRRRTLQQHP